MNEIEITKMGNPAKPQGEAGKMMLERMNQSHYNVTGWALEHWDIKGSDNILDMGCGGGMTLKRMSEKVSTGKLTGADYSPVSVTESENLNAADIKSGKMSIFECSVENLPFSDNSFDKIITVESFYFWPNPGENLKEIFRVLKCGGEFMLVADIYNNDSLTEEELKNIELFKLFNPSKEEFSQLFKNAGFNRTEIFTKPGENWICVKGKK